MINLSGILHSRHAPRPPSRHTRLRVHERAFAHYYHPVTILFPSPTQNPVWNPAWASKEGVDSCTLSEWVGSGHSKLLIKWLKSQGDKTRKRQVLKDTRWSTALREIHTKYVLVPADTASNIIIVCKKYYTEVIRKQLDKKSGKISACIHCRDSVDQIVQKHLAYMYNAKVKVTENMKRLPGFYWMPKLHKNPYGHRFIAASTSCTTKPLSKLLIYTHCLRLKKSIWYKLSSFLSYCWLKLCRHFLYLA